MYVRHSATFVLTVAVVTAFAAMVSLRFPVRAQAPLDCAELRAMLAELRALPTQLDPQTEAYFLQGWRALGPQFANVRSYAEFVQRVEADVRAYCSGVPVPPPDGEAPLPPLEPIPLPLPPIPPERLDELDISAPELPPLDPLTMDQLDISAEASADGGTRVQASGTAGSDVASVTVTVESEPIVRTIRPDDGRWSFDEVLPLDPGPHEITVVARDASDRILGDVRRTFTVARAAPVLDRLRAFRARSDVQRVNQVIVAPAVVAVTAVSTGAALAGVGVQLGALLRYLAALFTEPFLLFARKRRRPWGTVYHALAKRPVDLAIVRLLDAASGRIRTTRVTDREGRFAFLPDPGAYRLDVRHPRYVFPSRILRGAREDAAFSDLYHGGDLEVADARASMTVNIPLDPKDEPRDGAALRRHRVQLRAQTAIAYSGPVLALVSAAISPTLLLIGFVVAHGLLLLAFRRFAVARRPKSFGVVRDATTKRPIANAIVRLFDATRHKLLEAQVTNRRGQYGFLVGPNRFVVHVEKQGYAAEESSAIDRTSSGGAITEHFDLTPRGA